MRDFWIMLSHTYLSKLKAKSFIVTTLIVAAGILVMANINHIIDLFQGEDKSKHVVVIDETGELLRPLQNQVDLLNENIKLEASAENISALEAEVEDGIYEGVLILTAEENGLPKATYKSQMLSSGTISSDLQAALQAVRSMMAASNLELSPEEMEMLNAPVSFQQEALTEGAKSEEQLNQARGIVYVLLFFLYFSVIMYANMVATEIAAEKSSRVMELLISSVSPVKQMFAKILGIGLVGLTQLTVLLLVGYLALVRNQENLVGGFFDAFGFGNLSWSIIFYAIVFFLLGYFLYATLAALLGSLVSRTEEVQQMIMPMTFLVMVGFFIAISGLGNPGATFVTIASYIPFFTPMVMFLRVGMLTIPAFEPVLGIVILMVTIGILAIFGAKVYRGGVLMYGKSNSYKDIKKAIALTKK